MLEPLSAKRHISNNIPSPRWHASLKSFSTCISTRRQGQAVADGFQLIDDLEAQMTVYRESSEVSRLNQNAFEQPVVVEEKLFNVLKLAKELYALTDGAFDITAGSLSRLWKLDQRNGELPKETEIAKTLDSVGSKYLQLTEVNDSVRFTKKGVSINLGGIGKGHALDLVSELFRNRGIFDFIIHGGQSSVLACGNSTEAGGEKNGWSIGLTHPTLPGQRLETLSLDGRALGTSGTARQGFFHNGKRYGHIIDPRTGWPASHILSSTVLTQSAAVADALATAFFVMDLDQIQLYCNQVKDVAAIIVLADEKSKVCVERFNLA